MSTMSSRLAPIGLLAAALVLAPQPAHAQLGGFIKRKVAEKIGEKGAQKVTGENPQEDARDLAITEERMAALIENGKAQMDYQRRHDAWEAQLKAQQAKQQEYVDCMGGVTAESQAAAAQVQTSASASMAMVTPEMREFGMKVAEKMQSMSPAEQKEFEKKMDALKKRAQIAQKNHDVAEGEAIKHEFEQLVGVKIPDGMMGPMGPRRSEAELAAMEKRGQEAERHQQAADKKMAHCSELQASLSYSRAPEPQPPAASDYNAPIADIKSSNRVALFQERMRRLVEMLRNHEDLSKGFTAAEIAVIERHKPELQLLYGHSQSW